MTLAGQVLGIHHVTAIASDPQRNLDFYAGLLGLRLVKRTVNFDDPETYHFYFGDDVGHPGSIMTFFPWPSARRGRVGTGQVAVTSFAVLPSAMGFWIERLLRHHVAHEGPKGGVLAFTDPDGLQLELVADAAAGSRSAWDRASGIGRDQAIRGFHSVTLWGEHGDATARVLVDTLGFRPAGEEGATKRFIAGDGGPGTLVRVRTVGGFPPGAGGAGTVHHIAWRVADDATQLVLRDRVIAAGLQPTGVIDRQYFHSVYFREPGHVLFELATDPPGFTVDEPVERLGEGLRLPPWLEPRRTVLEAALPRIDPPVPPSGEGALDFIHRYHPPAAAAEVAGRTTLLLLHGTGGNEDDLIPLGHDLLPGAGLLSPRGKVLEGGAPRFFRRRAEGVFDEQDLARRTDELARFVERAVERYELDRHDIVGVGFSNGANIAVSLLFKHPGLLRSAVLFSPMLPYEPAHHPDLHGTSVFIGAGRADPIAPAAQVERLAERLREAGADVTLFWDAGGHGVSAAEVAAARTWIGSPVATRAER